MCVVCQWCVMRVSDVCIMSVMWDACCRIFTYKISIPGRSIRKLLSKAGGVVVNPFLLLSTDFCVWIKSIDPIVVYTKNWTDFLFII